MNPKKTILQLAAPLAVSFWMRAAFTFVDTIYASTLGDSAVAAIGLTLPFEFLMIALWVGTSTGLTSKLSQALGAQRHAAFEQYLTCGWRLVMGMVPLFLMVGLGIWIFAPHMNLETEVMQNFQIYGAVLFGGSAFTGFWAIVPDSLVKVYQDTKTTMWAGIFSNLLNVGLNTLFLFVFHWGIFGIAFSTVIGRLAGLGYASIKAWKHEQTRKKSIPESYKPTLLDPTPYRSLFSLAIPSAATFLLMATEPALINYLLTLSNHATEAIAAYSIYFRVTSFALQPVIATGVALLPFTAYYFGQKDMAQIRKGLRQTEWATAVYAVILVAPLMIWVSPALANFLTESMQTRHLATTALYFTPLNCLLGAQFFLCRPIFEGMQRGTPGLALAILRYVFLTAPLTYVGMLVAQSLGYAPLFGILAGLLTTSLIASILFIFWLNRTLLQKEKEVRTES